MSITPKNVPSKEELDSIPTIADEDHGSLLGEIKINHTVVANIARLSALEVEGVYSIGSTLVEGITEIFSKKESDRGVRVSEDEVGHYVLEVRVILRFGVSLAKTALQIQENISEKIGLMTMKKVAKVDVIIDGVKMDEPK